MDTPDPGGSLKKPRRAEPLQPDAPASGDDAQESEDTTSHSEQLEKQEYQSDKALRNVREGYK